jgi:hypothetical protein
MLPEQQFQNLGRYREAFQDDPRVNESPGPRRGFYVLSSVKGDILTLPLESESPDDIIQVVRQYLNATDLSVLTPG